MSKSSMRIVLVDPLGDILFSGESMVAQMASAPRPEPEPVPVEEEPCPQTKRSAESGVFPALRRPINRTPIVIEPTPPSDGSPEVVEDLPATSERAA